MYQEWYVVIIYFWMIFSGLSRLYAPDLGLFRYCLYFRDCFNSRFDFEVLNDCIILIILKDLIYLLAVSRPFLFLLFCMTFVTTWVILLVPFLVGLTRSSFIYNSVVWLSIRSIGFSYSRDIVSVSILFMLVTWFIIFSESSYYYSFLYFIEYSLLEKFTFRNFLLVCLGILFGAFLFSLLRSSSPLLAMDRPEYPESFELKSYDGGVESRKIISIDGERIKKKVRFTLPKEAFIKKVADKETQFDTTVKFAGVCLNKAHLLPPIPEYRFPTLVELWCCVEEEEFGVSVVARSQPRRVSFICNCGPIVPREWALPLTSSECKELVRSPPIISEPTIDLFRIGVIDPHSLHRTSVYHYASSYDIDNGCVKVLFDKICK